MSIETNAKDKSEEALVVQRFVTGRVISDQVRGRVLGNDLAGPPILTFHIPRSFWGKPTKLSVFFCGTEYKIAPETREFSLAMEEGIDATWPPLTTTTPEEDLDSADHA